jgi:hypothetical protein
MEEWESARRQETVVRRQNETGEEEYWDVGKTGKAEERDWTLDSGCSIRMERRNYERMEKPY